MLRARIESQKDLVKVFAADILAHGRDKGLFRFGIVAITDHARWLGGGTTAEN